MKYLYTIKDDQYVVIDDKDNRYKVYQIDDSNLGVLKRLFNSYLSLLASEHDLKYARQYIDQMFFHEDTTLIDGALINSAIQLLVKCFTNPGGKGRSQLDEKKVFDKYAQSIGRESYLKQYYDLYNARNRSLAHDDSDFKDNMVGITVDTRDCKLVEIAYINMRRRFLYKENANILKDMITITLEFINEQKQQIEKRLIEHYSAISFSEISKYKMFDCKGIELSNCW
jgi:hypothetical protein